MKYLYRVIVTGIIRCLGLKKYIEEVLVVASKLCRFVGTHRVPPEKKDSVTYYLEIFVLSQSCSCPCTPAPAVRRATYRNGKPLPHWSPNAPRCKIMLVVLTVYVLESTTPQRDNAWAHRPKYIDDRNMIPWRDIMRCNITTLDIKSKLWIYIACIYIAMDEFSPLNLNQTCLPALGYRTFQSNACEWESWSYIGSLLDAFFDRFTSGWSKYHRDIMWYLFRCQFSSRIVTLLLIRT